MKNTLTLHQNVPTDQLLGRLRAGGPGMTPDRAREIDTEVHTRVHHAQDAFADLGIDAELRPPRPGSALMRAAAAFDAVLDGFFRAGWTMLLIFPVVPLAYILMTGAVEPELQLLAAMLIAAFVSLTSAGVYLVLHRHSRLPHTPSRPYVLALASTLLGCLPVIGGTIHALASIWFR